MPGLVEEGDVEPLGEILAQLVARAHLKALPSRIMASQVQVVVAPAKRSWSVLRPDRTGMARTFTMKSS